MNGNDLIEFEENNQEELQSLFIKENLQEFLNYCMTHEEEVFIDLIYNFIENNQEEWNKSVLKLWEYKQGE